MTTPRCFIVRHGETEWSLDGRHTGTSDIPLTRDGEKRVEATGRALVGHDRLIVPSQLVHIYVSPRSRAQKTLELLHLDCVEPYPWSTTYSKRIDPRRTFASTTVTPLIAEWDYGQYEGVTSKDIRAQREKDGLGSWDIWKDGCPGGESPAQIIDRLDALIKEIREKWHAPAMGKTQKELKESKCGTGDVLVVGHGHILRAFAMRWIAAPLEDTKMIMEAGGVGTLSYEHKSVDEPAILLGGAFVVKDD